MSETDIERRKFLYATGVTGAALIAGCSTETSGGSDGGSGDGSSGESGDGSAETTAGGSGDGESGDGSSGGDRTYLDEEPNYDGWLEDANNYEQTVDMTDKDEVTVTVGYESTAFDPAAIAISTGTKVTWEWNGQGGSHNVVSKGDGPLESESSSDEGFTYSHTFEEAGTYLYSCTPHKALGMKGAVYVE